VHDQGQGWLQRLFQPKGSRSIPYARAWNIVLRTAHLMATSFLVGGYAFGASADQLKPLLSLSIATGIGLIVVEAYPSLHFVFEGWGLFLLCKLAVLGFLPFAHRYRVTILLAIIALAAVGSHVPARFRHYSLLYRKTIER
jgi:hypothetical protein